MNVVELAYSKNRDFHIGELRSLGLKTEVLWKGGAKSQRDRFRQIARLLPNLTGKSLLDVGCGFGDLGSFLKGLGQLGFKYCGIDLCPEMVEVCRRQHPDREFHETGLLEFAAQPRRFDFAIASGLFAMPVPDWESYIVATVRSMFEITREAVVVNFLSDYSQSPSHESHYANPGQTLDLLMRSVTPWAVLLHDYRWNDFTIGLFHQPR